ncbi:MAG TPA: hypothetical protein VLZ50_05960, partial [Terracidiphilus sp.]|nr:hypothetical protein [Terracidiphilus sp.]
CNYVLLLKVDAAGRLTWKSTVQHRCKAFSGQVLEVSDGYIVTGSESTGFLHEGNLVVWPTVMKISKAGAVLWAKKLTVAAPVPQPNQFLNGGGITELKDGSLLFAWAFWTGYPLPTDPTASWLVKMDPAGRIQWERVYRSAALEIGASNVVENADEGAFLLNGLVIDKATENRVLLILKINTATGGILKRMSIRHAGGNVTGTLFHANWGGLYFSGRQSSLSEIGPFLALFGKLNPTTLTPIWARTFDGGGESGAAIGTATGFLVAGDTEKYGTDPSGGNTFAATLDKNGNYSGCHVQAATLEAEIPTLKATTPPHKETDILFKAMNLGKAVNYPSLSVNTLALPVATICPSSTAAPAARCEQ